MKVILVKCIKIRNCFQNLTDIFQFGKNLYPAHRIHRVGFIEAHPHKKDFFTLSDSLFQFKLLVF